MARLFWGEKKWKREDILRVLARFEHGLTESEVAELLRWDRRTVNNYLRELQNQQQVYKEGRVWLKDESN
ncbi:MAG TPA: helix-turn-helix domain-containing protein [Anaerolineae bacterium]|nr:helix-turn-helix domain-containing protein [Anaerolineae bacterium]